MLQKSLHPKLSWILLCSAHSTFTQAFWKCGSTITAWVICIQRSIFTVGSRYCRGDSFWSLVKKKKSIQFQLEKCQCFTVDAASLSSSCIDFTIKIGAARTSCESGQDTGSLQGQTNEQYTVLALTSAVWRSEWWHKDMCTRLIAIGWWVRTNVPWRKPAQ